MRHKIVKERVRVAFGAFRTGKFGQSVSRQRKMLRGKASLLSELLGTGWVAGLAP